MHRLAIVFVGFLLVCYGFRSDGQSLAGRWIGVHTEQIFQKHCPLPVYMDLNPDSTWQLGLIDESAAPRTGTWGLENALLRLDTTHYAPEQFALKGDLLYIGQQPMLFRRFSPQPVAADTVWKQLRGQLWQTDSLECFFAADGCVAVRNRRSGVQSVHYANVLKMHSAAFLFIRGSVSDKQGPVRAFWQVVASDDKKISLLGSNGSTVGLDTLRWVRPVPEEEADLFKSTVFQPCAGCAGPPAVTTTANVKVAALFRRYFQPIPAPGESGLIMLTFVQNCAGERGPPVWQELDNAYRKRSFDKQILTSLYTVLEECIPAPLFDRDGYERTDRLIVLTFRLQDGRLTDVF